jgi:hypothetical protein
MTFLREFDMAPAAQGDCRTTRLGRHEKGAILLAIAPV